MIFKQGMVVLFVCSILSLTIPNQSVAGRWSLSSDYISRFLKDFPGYVAQVQKYQNIAGQSASDYVNARVIAKEITDFLEKRGWNPEEFSTVSGWIMKAFSALKYEEVKVQGASQLKQAQEELKKALNDPSLTPEMKAMLQQSLAQAQTQLKGDYFKDVPQDHLDMVRPYVPKIQAMLDGLSLPE
jgi:hypothetical protein